MGRPRWLFLDNRHRLIEYVEMLRGTTGSATVHAREVVKEALQLNAAAVILAHPHPGGNAEPSADCCHARTRGGLGPILFAMLTIPDEEIRARFG